MTKRHKNLHSRKFSSDPAKMGESFSLSSPGSEATSVRKALVLEGFHVH